MDLTPGQRRLVFVVIVIVLVGLGFYLIQGRGSGGTPAAAPSTPARTAAPAASTSSAADVPPSVVPAPTPVSTAGGAEIYQWLPFTPADLTAAAQATTSFAADYVTWSYQEDTAAYVAKMRGLVTTAALTAVEAGYGTPGVASQRTTDKQVSTGTGTIDSISSFGTSSAGTSITFLVTINQQVTSTQPTATTAPQYTVTVLSSGGAWQVSNINLSDLGNT
jgi:hypothetical protein